MIHEDAVDLIQFFEGCSNVAYACPSHVSNGGKWPHLTIGYGHSGPDVTVGMKITTSQARELLARDLANVEAMVSSLVHIKLPTTAMGAVCAIAFNLKPGLFRASKMLAALNARDYGQWDFASSMRSDLGTLSGMAREWAEFRSCQMADGKLRVLKGLVKRRAAELELFFVGHWSVPDEDRMPQGLIDMSSTKPDVSDMLRPGMRQELISDLHDALGAAGFPVTCGDAYTWVTVDAVKAFQQANNLKVDGIYGPATARRLAEVLEARQ